MDIIQKINKLINPLNVFSTIIALFCIYIFVRTFYIGFYIIVELIFITVPVLVFATLFSLVMKFLFTSTPTELNAAEKNLEDISIQKKQKFNLLSILFYSPSIILLLYFIYRKGDISNHENIFFGNTVIEIHLLLLAIFIIYIISVVFDFFQKTKSGEVFYSGVEVFNIKILDFILYTIVFLHFIYSVLWFLNEFLSIPM